MNITQTIDFVALFGAGYNPNFIHSDGWTCTFEYDGREMEVPFYMGKGHNGARPTKEEVLNALFLDAESTDSDFNDWCNELGYDNDSIRALETYNNCVKIADDLKHLLGSAYDTVREEIYELQI